MPQANSGRVLRLILLSTISDRAPHISIADTLLPNRLTSLVFRLLIVLLIFRLYILILRFSHDILFHSAVGI